MQASERLRIRCQPDTLQLIEQRYEQLHQENDLSDLYRTGNRMNKGMTRSRFVEDVLRVALRGEAIDEDATEIIKKLINQ